MKTAYINAISEMLQDYSEEYLFNMLVKMGKDKYSGEGGVPQHLIEEATRQGSLIGAIKFLRTRMGTNPDGSIRLSLKDAKDLCDRLNSERGLWPTAYRY